MGLLDRILPIPSQYGGMPVDPYIAEQARRNALLTFGAQMLSPQVQPLPNGGGYFDFGGALGRALLGAQDAFGGQLAQGQQYAAQSADRRRESANDAVRNELLRAQTAYYRRPAQSEGGKPSAFEARVAYDLSRLEQAVAGGLPEGMTMKDVMNARLHAGTDRFDPIMTHWFPAMPPEPEKAADVNWELVPIVDPETGERKTIAWNPRTLQQRPVNFNKAGDVELMSAPDAAEFLRKNLADNKIFMEDMMDPDELGLEKLPIYIRIMNEEIEIGKSLYEPQAVRMYQDRLRIAERRLAKLQEEAGSKPEPKPEKGPGARLVDFFMGGGEDEAAPAAQPRTLAPPAQPSDQATRINDAKQIRQAARAVAGSNGMAVNEEVIDEQIRAMLRDMGVTDEAEIEAIVKASR